MNSGFQMDTEANRSLTLKAANEAAHKALQEYEVDWQTIDFIQLSEHITFRLSTHTGEQFLLRVHATGKSSKDTISELEWLTALKRKRLTVPDPIPNRAGNVCTEVSPDNGPSTYVTVLSWINGKRMDKGSLTDEMVRKMGELMARLHEASYDFCPTAEFSRPSWGRDTFQHAWRHLQLKHSHFITENGFELYTQAAAKVVESLSKFVSHERNYGMIHADLHLGNLVFLDSQPYPIDFGRCGYGYHLYDIAQAVMGLFPKQRALFIEGYEGVRKMEPQGIRMLECFFIMAIIEAYSFHAENPLETDGLVEEQPYAQAIIKAYINQHPFLFIPLDLP